jgi:hypothetical protein
MESDQEKKLDPELVKYRDELISLQHKSQEAFERQLSYLSTGALALSIGFIKDVVKNISAADLKWLLDLGWGLLAATLLVNCFSHIRAAELHNKTIKDINNDLYDPTVVTSRYKIVGMLNWASMITMFLGIVAIVIFVIQNIYHG